MPNTSDAGLRGQRLTVEPWKTSLINHYIFSHYSSMEVPLSISLWDRQWRHSMNGCCIEISTYRLGPPEARDIQVMSSVIVVRPWN